MQKFFLFLFLLPILAVAQKKQITLEDIYKNRTFRVNLLQLILGRQVKILK